MKYNLYIHVNKKHIDAGLAKSCSKCPVGLAINECLKPDYHAEVPANHCIELCYNYNECDIVQYATHLRYFPEVVRFINDFDEGKQVKPFIFVLKQVDERLILGF